MLAYHKFDANGKSQLYNARLENGKWKIYQTSDWNYRWWFEGGGSINNDIRISPVTVQNGKLHQSFTHKEEGSKVFVLDEATLKPTGTIPPKQWPAEIKTVRSGFPEMQVRTQNGRGGGGYMLRWEVLPKFRDAPRPKPWPEPVMLEIYKLEKR